MFSRPAVPTNNFTGDERSEGGEEVGCPGSDDGKSHRQEGKEVPSTKSHQGTAYSLTLSTLVCSSKHKQGLPRQLRRNSCDPLSRLVSSSPGGFRSLRVAPIPGLQLPGLELWSRGCWQTVQSLSHGWQCPFPPLRGLSPAPLGKQLRLSVALSPLPAPLRSFSSLNISAAFTCACHTDFSTLFYFQHSFYFQGVKGLFRVHKSLCIQWHFSLSSLPWDFFITCRWSRVEKWLLNPADSRGWLKSGSSSSLPSRALVKILHNRWKQFKRSRLWSIKQDSFSKGDEGLRENTWNRNGQVLLILC